MDEWKQMTIFDFLAPPSVYPDFRTMEREEVVALIGRECGFRFIWNEQYKEWQCRQSKPKRTVSVDFDEYKTMDDRRGKTFIGVGMTYSSHGWSGPCDTIDEAIKRLKERMVEK